MTFPPKEQPKELFSLFVDLFEDNLDFLACKWLQIMPREVNITHFVVGFDSEEDLVETFNDAESDMQMLAGMYKHILF